MAETHGETFLFEEQKLGRIIKPSNRHVLSRGLEILADGNDVTVDRSKITHDLSRFVDGLAHSYNQAGLRLHPLLLGFREKFNRSLILPLGSD